MSSELLAVVVGGAIGLAGSIGALVFGWLQAKSSRAFTLRQTIYVDAAIAMADSLDFFSKVSDLTIDDGDLAAMVRPTSGAMFKIHLVGTPGTIAALSEANYEMTVAAADLVGRRAQLRSMLDASEAGTGIAPVLVARLRIELFIEAMRASLNYQRRLADVNLEARRELGFPLVDAAYRSANLKAEARIVAVIEGALKQLKQLQPNGPLPPTSGAPSAGQPSGS